MIVTLGELRKAHAEATESGAEVVKIKSVEFYVRYLYYLIEHLGAEAKKRGEGDNLKITI